MVRSVRSFCRARSAQTAIADAVIALIVLTMASAVLYSAVSSAVSTRSEARQRADLKATALQASGLPLEATFPKVTYKNLSSGKEQTLVNLTGEDIITTILELQAISDKTGHSYDLSSLGNALRDLYQWALEGRSYAVHAHGTVLGRSVSMLFSSEAKDGQDPIRANDDIPNPRVVTQRTIHSGEGTIAVDLYLWK
jgi:hypothetical protein